MAGSRDPTPPPSFASPESCAHRSRPALHQPQPYDRVPFQSDGDHHPTVNAQRPRTRETRQHTIATPELRPPFSGSSRFSLSPSNSHQFHHSHSPINRRRKAPNLIVYSSGEASRRKRRRASSAAFRSAKTLAREGSRSAVSVAGVRPRCDFGAGMPDGSITAARVNRHSARGLSCSRGSVLSLSLFLIASCEYCVGTRSLSNALESRLVSCSVDRVM